jgi:hypothetical protein
VVSRKSQLCPLKADFGTRSADFAFGPIAAQVITDKRARMRRRIVALVEEIAGDDLR